MEEISGNKAKKFLRLFNKQIRKELVKGIHKMTPTEAIEMFKKLFEAFDGGYRPKKDLAELMEGDWDFEAFKNITKKKERKKPEKKVVKKVIKKVVKKVVKKKVDNTLEELYLKGQSLFETGDLDIYNRKTLMKVGKRKKGNPTPEFFKKPEEGDYEDVIIKGKKYIINVKTKILYDPKTLKEVGEDKKKDKSATTETKKKLKEQADKIKITISDFDEEEKLKEQASKIKINISESIEGLSQDKREVFEDLSEMVEEYLKNDKEAVPFGCSGTIDRFIFLKILKAYGNSCIFLKRKIKDKQTNPKFLKGELELDPRDIEDDDIIEAISKKYIECAKRGKMLALPLTFYLPGEDKNQSGIYRFLGRHRNMIVLNPVRKEIEWYEPHGEEFQGRSITQAVDTDEDLFTNKTKKKAMILKIRKFLGLKPGEEDVNKFNERQVEKLVKQINKDLKNEGQSPLKYVERKDLVCPTKKKIDIYVDKAEKRWLKGLDPVKDKKKYDNLKGQLDDMRISRQKQGLQGLSGETLENIASTTANIDTFDIEDPGGFCCMWSFLRLELRLKNPNKSGEDLDEELREALRGKPSEQVQRLTLNFIRNYTDSFLKELVDKVGRRDYLEYFVNRKMSVKRRDDIRDKILKVTMDIFKELGDEESIDKLEGKVKKTALDKMREFGEYFFDTIRLNEDDLELPNRLNKAQINIKFQLFKEIVNKSKAKITTKDIDYLKRIIGDDDGDRNERWLQVISNNKGAKNLLKYNKEYNEFEYKNPIDKTNYMKLKDLFKPNNLGGGDKLNSSSYFNNNLDNEESFMSYIDYVDKSSLINDFTQANEGYEKVLNYMLDENEDDTRVMGLEKLVKNLKFNFLT